MDLSTKSHSGLERDATPVNTSAREQAGPPIYHDPRQYVMPISSAPYIQSAEGHQYHDAGVNQHPYFYSQGSAPHVLSPYSQALYSQPSPLFHSQPHLPPRPPPPQPTQSFSSLTDENLAYGPQQMLDGMGPKGAKPKQKGPTDKGPTNKRAKGGPKAQNKMANSEGESENFGTLRELLQETLQQEVDALDILKNQIAQLAVITQNAEQCCNMNALNPVLARQGLLNVVPPRFLPPPPAHHQLRAQPGIHRPVPRPMVNPQFRQPPPAHTMNNPRRAHPARHAGQHAAFAPFRHKNPMNYTYQTLHEVENRLKNCEMEVAQKIQMYENHVKRINGRQQELNTMDIKNMAVRTLQDIERRLKDTEKNMDGRGGGGGRHPKRDMGVQTPPSRGRKAKLPNNQWSEVESLRGLSDRVEADVLESKFAKKIILLLYSHLRKLARGALEKGKGHGEVDYKAMMEANGVIFSVPTGHSDEFDELAINVELKIPMNMFEGDPAGKVGGKERKLGRSLSRCRRKCCKKKKRRRGDGYASEPENHSRRSRRDGECEEKGRRHYSAPQRRISSGEEEDMDVLEARTRRIKEYLDSSTVAVPECEDVPRDACALLEREEQKDGCVEDKVEEEQCEKVEDDQNQRLDCGEPRRLPTGEVDEIIVENASKRDQACERDRKHHHHHHHHHNHGHHHRYQNVHRGLDSIGEQIQACDEKRITWPKDAYLAKYKHHGTFWPMWTESPYCREAATLEDVPTLIRDCTAEDDEEEEEEEEWNGPGRGPRLWGGMDGARASHFTSVSEPQNDIYCSLRVCGENVELPEGTGEQNCEYAPKCHDPQPEDLSVNAGPPYHMQVTMAGPFYPETITRVVAPGPAAQVQPEGADGECAMHSSRGCVKGQLIQDGLQFNYY